MNQVVDLAFSLQSNKPLPADHGYALYGALSRVWPQVHRENGIGIHPIRGQQIGERKLMLDNRSRLVIRASAERIPELLPLAGKQVSVNESSLRIGVPQVWSLRPSTAVRSRLVTIKLTSGLTEEAFLQAAKSQLVVLGISDTVQITTLKRRTLRIKDKEIVGYEVIVEGLSAEESLDLQERGIGGRRHMGCGVFVPLP